MILVVVGFCRDNDGQILIQRRPRNIHLGGKWEFPGGKVDPGETMREALAREWMEELGVKIRVGDLIDECVVSYPDINSQFLLPLFEVEIVEGSPSPQINQVIEWVEDVYTLGSFDFVQSFQKYWYGLIDRFES